MIKINPKLNNNFNNTYANILKVNYYNIHYKTTININITMNTFKRKRNQDTPKLTKKKV